MAFIKVTIIIKIISEYTPFYIYKTCMMINTYSSIISDYVKLNLMNIADSNFVINLC